MWRARIIGWTSSWIRTRARTQTRTWLYVAALAIRYIVAGGSDLDGRTGVVTRRMVKSHKLLYDGVWAMNLVREGKLSFSLAHVVTERQKKKTKMYKSCIKKEWQLTDCHKEATKVISKLLPRSTNHCAVLKPGPVSFHLFVASWKWKKEHTAKKARKQKFSSFCPMNFGQLRSAIKFLPSILFCGQFLFVTHHSVFAAEKSLPLEELAGKM